MISPKKLIKMARKWQKFAGIRQKKISMARSTESPEADTCNTSSTTDKGHFVVYSADHRRFVIPLAYLKDEIFRELLKLAEEEYGLPKDGPITLPCDAVFMEYAISFIQRHAARDLRRAFLVSITSGRCLSSSNNQQGQINRPMLIL